MLIEDLIRKYRSNTLTPDELGEMRRLLQRLSPAEIDKAMDAIVNGEGVSDGIEPTPEMIERVKRRLDHEIMMDLPEIAVTLNPVEPIKSDPSRKWKIMSTAAMIIGLLAVGLSVFFVAHTHSLLSTIGYTEISTGFGEKSRIALPDGTIVSLAGRTTLRYPSDLALGHREIEFNGEAYFNVSKDSRHPFIVNGDGVTVKVTGTSFNFYSRSNSESAEVILDTGSVSVSTPEGQTVKLSSGESVIYDKKTGKFDIAVFRSNPMLRRRIFGVRYDSIAPSELIKKLEERYEVTISKEISTAINSPFTGVLPDDDINETLSILSKIYGFAIPYNREKTP